MARGPTGARQYPGTRCQYPVCAGGGQIRAIRVSSPWHTGRQSHVSTPARAVSTPFAPAVRFEPSESVPRGSQAVSTPCADVRALRSAGTVRRSIRRRARAVSTPPSGPRVSSHPSPSVPDCPASPAYGRLHHQPGQRPASALHRATGSARSRSRPRPAPPPQGASSTGPQIVSFATSPGSVRFLFAICTALDRLLNCELPLDCHLPRRVCAVLRDFSFLWYWPNHANASSSSLVPATYLDDALIFFDDPHYQESRRALHRSLLGA